jgi:hypothetical protein
VPEIAKADAGRVAGERSDEKVLWLHVAVEDAVGMQVVERFSQLRPHAEHSLLRERSVTL